MKVQFAGFTVLELLALAGCDDTQTAESLSPHCPSAQGLESSDVHSCATDDEPQACCIAAEGQASATDPAIILASAEAQADGLISQRAAYCIADGLGLVEGQWGRSGELEMMPEPRWVVVSMADRWCPESGLGDAVGCALYIDAVSGAYLEEATVHWTLTCL